ncbi:helix-turn-helix domain-containing protein [Oceanobacillus longus]|uniref:Helix-turn-helix domain-containing protein n=1 Tax=Oceanobacillus longus TaxID=930120 RepID=A0ABV8GUH7_9BACI
MDGFGRRLENLREKHGYSKKEISSKLGFHDNTYGQYEREERRPALETIMELAEIYHVDIDYLIQGEKSDNRTSDNSKAAKIEQLLNYFKNAGIEEPYFLQLEKWAKLDEEDLREITNHFEWIVHRASLRE